MNHDGLFYHGELDKLKPDQPIVRYELHYVPKTVNCPESRVFDDLDKLNDFVESIRKTHKEFVIGKITIERIFPYKAP